MPGKRPHSSTSETTADSAFREMFLCGTAACGIALDLFNNNEEHSINEEQDF